MGFFTILIRIKNNFNFYNCNSRIALKPRYFQFLWYGNKIYTLVRPDYYVTITYGQKLGRPRQRMNLQPVVSIARSNLSNPGFSRERECSHGNYYSRSAIDVTTLDWIGAVCSLMITKLKLSFREWMQVYHCVMLVQYTASLTIINTEWLSYANLTF